MKLKRTHYIGELDNTFIGKEIIISGWVLRRRDHGGVIFLDVRDRTGLLQVVFEEGIDPEIHNLADSIRIEYVISVKGLIRRRPPGMENPKIPTGEIELVAKEVEILNISKTPPFPMDEDLSEISEAIRLKYRYLEMRALDGLKPFIFRHKVNQIIREFLNSKGFLEIETPFLTKSTPEGARDYLVPSRLYPGKFYALPQSPQLFKQILMVAGVDKYYQIVRCFRDEDLRADRQPEFTQLDIEMSFVEENDVMSIVEELLAYLFEKALNITLETPFPRLSYETALRDYGTDRPDIRFDMKLKDLSHLFRETTFKVFRDALESGGIIKGLKVPANFSRKELDELTKFAQELGAKGLAWIKYNKNASSFEEKWSSPIVKFFEISILEKLEEVFNPLEDLATFFFVADKEDVVNSVLSELRIHLAKKINLVPENKFNFVWITDFPLFEWDEEENRLVSVHHPFTHPKEEDIPLLDTDPLKVKSKAYDIVLNGVEIGGGSIRIHKRELQEKIFKLLNIPLEEAQEKFGFLLTALEYGAPPHGGIAFGLDRLIMLMLGKKSIREVIPFPKTQRAQCLLTGAPSEVKIEQILELHLLPGWKKDKT
ncbi:aspartyl-tRNA synthetase [Thermodesulfobacterium geofontis OPF15]|uniref:Aspartate--tRNA(Asp/Asn) ligase n=1 Tax=Thermodesulfobacterium geofontis (strain OPF15) TaxID=795359 RepID=F8C2B4_THEGP|nr:aspartate--tRNA ligase [Thermodesulfobacterium geofontis]AEH23374.1 aspartyl-tRNA synthetase [Thermodesulfobacterium geofontis OPF15]